jgi:mannose-6-phosphate isomerase-like protein (cupin superfamily)
MEFKEEIVIRKIEKVVEKLWGKEEWIVNNSLFCGKILHYNQGYQSSLHYHKIKSEVFYILKGQLLLDTLEDKQGIIVNTGDVIEIPAGFAHRLSSPFGFAVVIEFSTLHSDDDVYRIEKSMRLK